MKRSGSTNLLMLSSLLVLACFLAFWLRDAYRDAETAMTEKGNLLYQESVRQVQDSVYRYFIQEFVGKAQKNEGFYADSLPNGLGRLNLRFQTQRDSITDDRFPGSERKGFRQLGLSLTTDSVSESDTIIYIEKLESIQHVGLSKRDEHLEGEIRKYFNEKLQGNDLPLDYTIEENKLNTDTTDLRFFPGDFNTYLSEEVVFTQKSSFLLGKISGQLLFSLFLFCLTAIAFASLQRSNQRALQYTQLKSDFMSNMTHELKTPITTIGLALEAMKGFIIEQNKDKSQEYLQISQHELNRLSLLVDKVLKLSLFENDVPKLKRVATDLQQVVNKVMDAMHIQIEQAGGQFKLETHGNHFQLMADPVHLTNVLFNLLDNSLKYAQNDPQVDIDLWEEAENIRLTISDNGMGIPPAYREKVFERFFRVPNTGNRHDVKGYGLGLSYVADIVKQHGGQIELDPNFKQGTRFIITLPKGHETA